MYNNLKIFLVSLKALSKKENLVGRKGISSNSRVNLKYWTIEQTGCLC